MAISLHEKLFLILILVLSAITKANTQCLEDQKALLVDLKKQLVFNSSKLVQWNETDECCRWKGVECDEAGHVTSLQLDGEAISGGFNESSSLFSLNYLEKLDLSHNFLEESDIPRQIHKLTHLTSLILSDCSLKGHLSKLIFQSPTLQVVDLSENPLLSGTLSLPQIFPPNNSFTTIVLSHTNFSGSLHAPAISNLQRLSRLDLSNCTFTGVIPFTLSNLTRLEDLDLSQNFFTGSISSIHFEALSNVAFMDLSYNSLSGTVPSSIFTLPSLQRLELNNNQFSGRVTEFPIVNNTYLSTLVLSSNRLESPIPNSFFKLQSLTEVYLSHNWFNESFQREKILSLPKLNVLDLSNNNFLLDDTSSNNFHANQSSSSLSDLDLSNNKIAGEIPGWIWEITSLFYLNLCCNMLVGLQKPHIIPSSTSKNFSSLRVLFLSNNKIAGEIPSWIWEIGNGSLFYLNLSSNMLVDLQKPYHVPPKLSLLNLDLHSNQLRSEFPYSLLQRAQTVDLSNNYFDKFNIGNFSTPFLSYLSLQNNSLSGLVPTFFCNTTSLEVLDLSVNNFSGSIPPCLFENISVLSLGRNNLSGRIPDKFSPHNCQLMSLDISYNDLFGDVPLSLANCKRLIVLNLSYNRLSGTVPTFLGQLESLAVLNLGRNNISGRVPNFTAADCPLQYLVLSNNNITGEVPTSLANCTSLEMMNVGNNMIEDKFPCMLPSTLRVLVLRSNRFHGEIRCHNKTWPNLQIIDIASNDFTGYLNPFNFSTWSGMMRDIVTKLSYKTMDFNNYLAYYSGEVTLIIKGVEQKLVKIWPDFTSIDLSNNNFHGHIPGEIGGLDGLYLLNLSHNSLIGLIPESFGNMTWLGSLDLSVNQLSGKIPKELAGLTFLQLMNVSHNKLVGQIPVSTQIQSFSPDCFEGNAGLCGLPLNISCTNPEPAAPVPNDGNVESEIEWEYVFAAAGYAVGLGIVSWVLLFCSSFREIYFEKAEDVFHNMFSFCKRKKKKNKRINGGKRVARR